LQQNRRKADLDLDLKVDRKDICIEFGVLTREAFAAFAELCKPNFSRVAG
jgi:hypothetical protein